MQRVGSAAARPGNGRRTPPSDQYAGVSADGSAIEFTPPPDGPPPIRLPQDRVFSREYGVRLKSAVSADFFRRLLADRGFEIEGPATGNSFTARRR
ncbi:hypothetical protein [Mycobacterium gallinarum]|uniref:hypothetical protein n=1 Tax=Mycobacterium gallinarum TaxID=39689 RepID=UPI0013D48EBD|nr:hypothetical protein [Mycobacterium gallinarum]